MVTDIVAEVPAGVCSPVQVKNPRRIAPHWASFRNYSSMTAPQRNVVDLVNRSRAGDREAFGQLVQPYHEKLLSLARRLVPARIARREDASDVVQNAFLAAQRGVRSFRGTTEEDFRKWLFAICCMQARKTFFLHIRTQKRALGREETFDDAANSGGQAELFAILSTPSQKVMRAEEEMQLWEAIAGLSEPEQSAIILRYIHGKSVGCVAQEINRTFQGAVGVLTRAMRKLRLSMGSSQ